jgi:hypothetical protein
MPEDGVCQLMIRVNGQEFRFNSLRLGIKEVQSSVSALKKYNNILTLKGPGKRLKCLFMKNEKPRPFWEGILCSVIDEENWNTSNPHKFRLPALFKIRFYDRFLKRGLNASGNLAYNYY